MAKKKTTGAVSGAMVDKAINNPTKPRIQLLMKLGSIAVHIDEMIETKFANVAFDGPALATVFDDEVRDWIKQMGPLLPAKRSTRG